LCVNHVISSVMSVTESKTKNTPKIFCENKCYCPVHGGETENYALYVKKSRPKSYFNYIYPTQHDGKNRSKSRGRLFFSFLFLGGEFIPSERVFSPQERE